MLGAYINGRGEVAVLDTEVTRLFGNYPAQGSDGIFGCTRAGMGSRQFKPQERITVLDASISAEVY
jgi:hypothetical protein